jgi:hypothetical protein
MNLPFKKRLKIYFIKAPLFGMFIRKSSLSKETKRLCSYLERGKEKLKKHFNLYHIIDDLRTIKYEVG